MESIQKRISTIFSIALGALFLIMSSSAFSQYLKCGPLKTDGALPKDAKIYCAKHLHPNSKDYDVYVGYKEQGKSEKVYVSKSPVDSKSNKELVFPTSFKEDSTKTVSLLKSTGQCIIVGTVINCF